MFNLKPIPAAAASMAAVLSLGTGNLWAQSSAAPDATPPAQEQSVQSLPAVTVEGERVDNDYKPDYSTVGGKTPTALRDIPQSVTVVNRAILDSQGATSLADALRNVPGITIGGAEGGQIGNNINLRGFTARTDIYLDGFRDPGQYYRDVFDMEQIEVLQGPSSMLFGRGSTGGVINQVTKQATLVNFSQVSGTAGTDGRLRATFDTNARMSDSSGLRVNAFVQNLQTTRDVMQNQDYGLAPTLHYGIGKPTEVIVSALIQHNNDMPDYGVQSLNGRPITASRDADYGLASDSTVQDVGMLNAVIKHRFNEQVELHNQTQYNHYSTNARETAAQSLGTLNGNTYTIISTTPAATSTSPPAFGNYDPNTLVVRLQSHDRVIADSALDNQTDLISKFNTGFIKHELITGLELGRETYSNQAYSRTGSTPGLPPGYVGYTSLMNPSNADPASQTITPGNLAASAETSVGIYANDTLSLNEQWKIVTGLRWDHFKAHINNNITAPLRADQTTDFTSVREGVLYQPTEEQSYYVSYGTSFNPLLEQLTFSNGQQGLPPTTTKSYEAGGKWDLFKDRIYLAAAAFREAQDNVYTKDTSGAYSAAGNWLIKGYTISATGHITEKLQIITGYMHLDPKVVAAVDGTQGSVPSNTPKDTVTLWTTYDVTHAWEVGGGGNFVSRRFVADTGITSTLPTGNIDLVSVPSYLRWDATAAYHQAQYEVRVNVLNLTNKQYYDALIQSDGGRSVPGIGRTGLLTATYKF